MPEKNELKEQIKGFLRGQALDKSLIAALCNVSEEEIEPVLREMTEAGELKYSENLELYKISTKKNNPSHAKVTKEECLSVIRERGIYSEWLIAKALNASRKDVKLCLEELSDEGTLFHSTYYDIYAPLLTAKLMVKSMGYAFARVEGEEEDYYISEDDIGNAFDGDICEIYPTGVDDKLRGACVRKVLTRAHTFVIGKLTMRGKKYPKFKIVSTMESFPVTVDVKPEDLNGAYVGAIVRAELSYTKGYSIQGTITEIVGNPNDPGIEISEIALEYGFKSEFSEETENQLPSVPDSVEPEKIKGRRDFRNKTVITIDGDDSKDFDDAVYLEILPGGNFMLEVHIADVSEYVTELSPLDRDALERGTSVYLADRVIPMLPYKLSNGICSLNEGVDRLVLSCLMEIDPKGKLVNYEICEGVINSHHRMTYNKVNKILKDDPELVKEYMDIYDMLKNMEKLSGILRELRYKKGGIEFESEEFKFQLNEDGSPKSVTKRTTDTAEKLIEDFMLAANETVAYHMSIMNLPSMYRVHEKPDQEKLHQVFQAIASMKVPVKNIKNDIHPKEIQTLLEEVKDNPNRLIINNMLLRSMMKAKYSAECLGHYGLAMNYYCHFTSPIRRYPDLMTHRMIKKLYLHPGNLESDIEKYTVLMPDIAMRNSESERKSVDCERAVDDMLYAWFMESRIGQSYRAVITSITNFGMFAELSDGTEGLIAYRDMEGYYDFDEKKMTASNGINTYHLGDRVHVTVKFASRKERKIDFEIEE